MSELTIDLNNLSVMVSDWAGGDPHVELEADGASMRIEATSVRRLADLLTGAAVMMTPEPEPEVVESHWRGTGGYSAGV